MKTETETQRKIREATERILAQCAADELNEAQTDTPAPATLADKGRETLAACDLAALADMADESAADVLRDCRADCGEIERAPYAERMAAQYNGGDSFADMCGRLD